MIRADASVALAMARKLASATKSLNYIASEIALLLERAKITKLVPQHIPARLNVEADWPRLGDRGDMPGNLEGVKLRRTTALSERSLALKPPGAQGSHWVQQLPHPNGVYDCL